MLELQQRIENDKITAEATATDAPAWAAENWDRHANWYSVTLRFGSRRMTTPFGMGSGLTHEPTAAEVLSSLVSDAATVENAASFEDWADELGYDADSRKAERTYRQVLTQTEKLRKFLGDAYDAYLWDTESL